MGAAPVLNIIKNGETVRSCSIEGEAILGRGEGCVIRLEDRAVSRQHAVLRPVEGGVQVEKKSEFAPLIVNGADCTSAIVKEGDVISIGPYLMRVSVPKSAEPRPEAQAPEEPAPVIPITDAIGPGLLAEGSANEIASVPEQPSGEAVDGALGEVAAPIDGGNVLAFDQPSGLEPPQDQAAPDPFSMVADSGGSVEAAPDPVDIVVEMADENAETKIAAVGKVSVKLIFKPGDANVTEFELSGNEVSIGRGQDCDVILNDKKASRRNSLLRRAGLNFVIKDLGSANGTYVNGERIPAEQDHELTGEDQIRIGAVEFQFKAMSLDYQAQEGQLVSPPVEPEVPAQDGLPEFVMPELSDSSAVLAAAPEEIKVPEVVSLDSASSGAAQGAQPILQSAAAPAPQTFPGIGLPGITDVPGLGAPKRKKGIIEWYKAQPKKNQIMVLIIVFLFLWWFMDDDPSQNPANKAHRAGARQTVQRKAGVPGEKPVATFESLTPQQKKFVETQHQLAMDYFKNRQFDKALFEVTKIFELLPDYKNARAIERYSREEKKRQDALEEEQRRKEEENRIKQKISQLVDDARDRMAKKQYAEAQDVFTQILAMDPENKAVAGWQKEIADYQEKVRLKEQEKEVQNEVNRRAWGMYRAGLSLRRHGKFHGAIAEMAKVIEIGPSDRKLLHLARSMIKASEAEIVALRDPILQEAKDAESSGSFAKAYQLYQKANRIDPRFPAGYKGVERVRDILHQKAEAVYTEAVIAESYSDLSTARAKFEECLRLAPPDDIYYDRAQRKLSKYYQVQGGSQ